MQDGATAQPGCGSRLPRREYIRSIGDGDNNVALHSSKRQVQTRETDVVVVVNGEASKHYNVKSYLASGYVDFPFHSGMKEAQVCRIEFLEKNILGSGCILSFIGVGKKEPSCSQYLF